MKTAAARNWKSVKTTWGKEGPGIFLIFPCDSVLVGVGLQETEFQAPEQPYKYGDLLEAERILYYD